MPLAVLRVILGILFVLYLPGYVLQGAVFPCVDELDEYERIALSFGLSIAVIPPIALLLDVLPWGIRLEPILIAEGAFIAVFAFASWYRRWHLPEDERFQIVIEIHAQSWWAEQDRTNRILYIILVIAFTVGFLAALAIILIPGPATRFTEFYILGEGGLAESYPREVVAGESELVTVGVMNREGKASTYRVEVVNGDEIIGQLDSFVLGSGETVEVPLKFAPVNISDDSKVEFFLYRDEGTTPYRSLRLWIKVTAP